MLTCRLQPRRALASLSPRAAARTRTLDPSGSVFAEFTPLAVKHNAVNLGQGFPNLPVPEFIRAAASNAVRESVLMHQYTRSMGHDRLVRAIANNYLSAYPRELDPVNEVVTTVGATEAIFATMQAFLSPGDEVILLEPFYDSYPASVTLAGGVPKFVPLRPAMNSRSSADWTLDPDELARAVTPRTRVIVINTPHNPLGKVFNSSELQVVADLAIKHDLLVLSDEVYETLVFDDSTAGSHKKIASLPGMWERTITVGSVGKTFSVTGWKVGWAVGPADLMRVLWMVHQFIPFSVATPMQEATAAAFEGAAEHNYFETVRQDFKTRRDMLWRALDRVGLQPLRPDGSYFIVADTSKVRLPSRFENADPRRDYNVCRWLTSEIGVAAIPPSAFYSPQHRSLASNLARFCFCKTDAMLQDAAERLQKLQA